MVNRLPSDAIMLKQQVGAWCIELNGCACLAVCAHGSRGHKWMLEKAISGTASHLLLVFELVSLNGGSKGHVSVPDCARKM